MRSIHYCCVALLASLLVSGCSSEPEVESTETAHVTDHPEPAPAEEEVEEEKPEEDTFVAPFPEKLDIFSPPKVMPIMIEEDEEEEEKKEDIAHDFPKPPVDLVGFVNVGEPKAMLKLNGETKIVGVGDKIKTLQVVEIKMPKVTLKHRWTEFDLSLFATIQGDLTAEAGMDGTAPVSPPAAADVTAPLPQLPDFPSIEEAEPLRLPPQGGFLEAE